MTEPDPSVRRTRVMVVDDEDAMRRGVRRLLERGPFEVHTASSVAEARDLVGDRPEAWGLFLLDDHLADGRGIDLAAWLRGAGVPACTPVLLFTGAPVGCPEQLAAAGISGVVRKPFTIAGLMDAVLGAVCRARDDASSGSAALAHTA